MDDVYTFVVAARDNASAAMRRVSGELRSMGGAAAGPAGPLARLSTLTAGLVSPTTLAIGAVAGLAAGALKLADAAREDEVSIAQLNESLKQNARDFTGNTGAVEAAIAARVALGFADDEQRESLRALVSVTKDSSDALRVQRVAMDLARLRNIDLRTATDLLGKVYGGNLGILSRYGIQIEKGASVTEALAEIQRRAAGQAEAWANTSEGASVTARLALEELGEEIGYQLLPVLTELAKFTRDVVVPALRDIANTIGRIAKPVIDAANAIDRELEKVGSDISDLNPLTWLEAWADLAPRAEQVATEGASAMTQPWAEAWAAMPDEAKAAYAESMQVTVAATPVLAAQVESAFTRPVRAAMRESRAFARTEMAQLPGDISNAIVSNLGDLQSGLNDLKALMDNSLSDAQKIARLRGILASKELAAGLRDERFDVRAAARTLKEETEAELLKLTSGAADAAADGTEAYVRFIRNAEGEAGRAAADIVRSVKNNLEFDGSDAGRSAASGYIEAFKNRIASAVPEINSALYYLKVNTIGGSLPRSGPMAHPETGAITAADLYSRTLGERLRRGVAAVQARIPPLGGGSPLAGVGGAGGGVTVVFQSTFPPTPAQADGVARQLLPALERERRRQQVQ